MMGPFSAFSAWPQPWPFQELIITIYYDLHSNGCWINVTKTILMFKTQLEHCKWNFLWHYFYGPGILTLYTLRVTYTRRFYSLEGDPLGVKGLKTYLP